ncbi:MAG: PspC domain-containing protein [Candidatus Zixiibacteriota bacterium]
MNKRLYRSRENKIVGGVCGGLGEYLGLDPTLVRIITVLLFILPGIGILTYIIAWIIIPMRPEGVLLADEDYKLSP